MKSGTEGISAFFYVKNYVQGYLHYLGEEGSASYYRLQRGMPPRNQSIEWPGDKEKELR